MSTRALIGVYDGTNLKIIYNHSDGYPAWLGKMLLIHYNSVERATALINLGAVSCVYERLAPNSGEMHSFDHRANGVTIAYARDRGQEKLISQYTVSSAAAAMRQMKACSDIDIDYEYLYDTAAQKWYERDCLYDTGEFTDLTAELCEHDRG